VLCGIFYLKISSYDIPYMDFGFVRFSFSYLSLFGDLMIHMCYSSELVLGQYVIWALIHCNCNLYLIIIF
jgi:hypothetical protein